MSINQWIGDEGWLGSVKPTALLVLADGRIIEGEGAGFVGETVGEICFNTSMTGYQEILTDPSYNRQIITFTFPHIGNVGANGDDYERPGDTPTRGASGAVLAAPITPSSNWRAEQAFDQWLKERQIIAITGVDTRSLTRLIRDHGMMNAVLAHNPDGHFDHEALITKAKNAPTMEGLDLVPEVTLENPLSWQSGLWTSQHTFEASKDTFHVVAYDFGFKTNILRHLSSRGCRITVVPASTSAEDVLALKPDGIFLSNGPGDPEATGVTVVPEIKKLLEANLPLFGICLGHQLLGLALGGKTKKMNHGHHGANHPVFNKASQRVEITSMNHGFAVDTDTLPDHVSETHRSLFDGTNCGLALKGRPVFSVQYHPEASPGPQDSGYLFDHFVSLMASHQT